MTSDDPYERVDSKNFCSPKMDRILWISVFLLLLSIAVRSNYPDPTYRNQKFAYEYGNIAEAVINGKGFSNPFPCETGPTAWMPPFYVYLIATVFKVCGVKSLLSLWILMLIKLMGMSTSLFFLLRIADQGKYGNFRVWLVPLFLIYVFAYRWQFFEELHDIWLTLLLTCWLVYSLTSLATSSFRRGGTSLLLLSFVIPLANPALGLSLLSILLIWILIPRSDATPRRENNSPEGRRGGPHRRARILLAALAIFACSVSLWTARNYVVFGRFIPLKSNFWFDFYQANYLVSDGIVSCSTFMTHHPINLAPSAMNHFAEGEQAFIEHFREESVAALQRDPTRTLRSIVNRAKNAFLFGDVYLDVVMAEKSRLAPTDLAKLRSSSLVFQDDVSGSVHWTSLGLSKDDFQAAVRHLKLDNVDRVLEDWAEAKRTFAASRRAIRTIVKRLLCSFVPTFCILCCILFREVRRSPVFILTLAVYSIHLFPYIIVSHYSRYQQGLIGLIVLFVFLAFHGVYARISGGNRRWKSGWKARNPSDSLQERA